MPAYRTYMAHGKQRKRPFGGLPVLPRCKTKTDRNVAKGQAKAQAEEEGSRCPTQDEAPKNALTEVAQDMVKVMKFIFEALRKKDVERRSRGGKARYWVVQDIDEFVQEFRASATDLATVPWATFDFTTMYEALEHNKLIHGCMMAAQEAWRDVERKRASATGRPIDQCAMCLGPSGWKSVEDVNKSPGGTWYTQQTLKDALAFMLAHLFVYNGGTLRRQIKGIPMGLACSGQLANLYCYYVESQWVDKGGDPGELVRRYIDDIFAAGHNALVPGVGFPSEEAYGMKYKKSSEDPDSIIYIGVRLFKDDKGQAHTVLHDRAVDYPIPIQRYPHNTTVANPTQFGGVIMGRLVAAQRTCSRLDLFQDAVAGIFTHAHRREYPKRMVHSVWTRFLARYCDAASVTMKELRAWFHKVWPKIVTA